MLYAGSHVDGEIASFIPTTENIGLGQRREAEQQEVCWSYEPE